MVDITQKHTSLRYAKAQAVVKVSSIDTINALVGKTVPKGDVLEFARVAGLFAVKKTSEMIPDCHPLPVEYTHISEIENYILNRMQESDLLLIAGGTGITNKDIVPRFLESKFSISANGLMEAARQYGFERDYKSCLSQGVAGIIENKFVINIPGSTSGALDTMYILSKSIAKILTNITLSRY